MKDRKTDGRATRDAKRTAHAKRATITRKQERAAKRVRQGR